MKRTYIFSVAAFAVAIFLYPQFTSAQQTAPGIQWEKSLGGNKDDEGYSIRQTSDSGFIVAGFSYSNDGNVTGHHGTDSADAWIVKLDRKGNVQWEKSFGGSGWDEANSIQQTKDGGYIFAGMSNSNDGDVTGNHGSEDYWIVKMDTTGNIQWEKSFGGTGYDAATCIQQTSDGGYIVAGYSESNNGDVTGHHGDTTTMDCWIIKLDSLGTMKWEKSFGGSEGDYAFGIQQTKDNGYIFVGVTVSSDGDVTGIHGSRGDYWVVKLDSLGKISWERCYGGSSEDEGQTVRQTNDGGYVVGGISYSSDGDVTGHYGGADYWILKLNDMGSMEWEKSLGGTQHDFASDIQQTYDDGFVIAGFSQSIDGDVTGNHGGYDYWIVNIDGNGTVQWQKSLGGSYDDECQSIEQTNDGGFIVAGYSSSTNGDITGYHGGYDYWIVKLSWSQIYSVRQQTFPRLSCDTREFDTVWVHNTGLGSLEVDSAMFNNANKYYTLVAPGAFPAKIAGGDSAQFVVRLSPTAAGTFTDTLALYNNDSNSTHNPWNITFTGRKDSVSFALQGTTNDTLDFGDIICSQPMDKSFGITNSSTMPLTFYVRSNDKSFTAPFVSIFLQANEQKPVEMRFTGNGVGLYTDSVEITDTCGREQTVYLRARMDSIGFAIQDVAADTLNFGVVLLATAKDTTVSIVNTSTLSATFSLSVSDTLFSVNNALPLAFNTSDTVTIHFAGENTPGIYIDPLLITDTCGRTQTVYLTITVNAPASAGIAVTDPIDAGFVHIDSSKTVLFTIKNPGNADLTIDSMTLLGTNAQYYQLKNVPQLPFTIVAGSSKTMNITFSPVNAGVQDAMLEIVTSLSTTAIDIAVDGIGTRSILQAEALNFDTVSVTACKTEEMKVTNAGDYPLLLTHVNILGAYASEYTVLSAPMDTLYPGDTADVTVKFCPLAPGEEDVAAELITNDGDTLFVTFYGAGSGTNAVREMLPIGTSLSQNYPNPFTNATTIRVTLFPMDAQNARLRVYNVLGEEISDLTSQLHQTNDIAFDASGLQSGVYYYTLETASGRATRQMFVVK